MARKALQEQTVHLLTGRGGQKGPLFLACGPEVFDRYGRILAYVGPFVPRSVRGDDPPPPRRAVPPLTSQPVTDDPPCGSLKL